ncbi:hypothetical protein [Aquimarina algiphila]|uniref:hypothetical protein n=1 Tax=Aquimarina algiphila TaxID=2047982 RepID=UPI002330037A|nr:hypothetical protein [Aquimarina algiphila]
MKNGIKFFLVFTLIFIGISCEKDDELPMSTQEIMSGQTETKTAYQNGAIVLGNKLENPYSIENMTQAYQNLTDGLRTGITAPNKTHYYVRFDPRTEEKLDLLKNDKTLELFSYPLDYEIAQGGDYYHDPQIPIDKATYQYATVPVGYRFPDVSYKILSELYLPQINSGSGSEGRVDNFMIALEDEALRITGNLDADAKTNKFAKKKFNKWNPDGHIRVWDNTIGVNRYVPVVGVEVRARRWFRVEKAITDSNGYFKTNSFRRPVNYSIKWERYDYSIRSGSFGQAVLNGPKQRERWDVNIGQENDVINDKQQYYAIIHQAAYDYYYTDRFGLSSPPRNSTLKPQIKIAAKFNSNKSSHAAPYARPGGILPTIYIRNWERGAEFVYGTTIHELAHAAHWDMDRNAFKILASNAFLNIHLSKGERENFERVIESWPEGVEWQFTTHRYRTLANNSQYSYQFGNQDETVQERPIYTTVVLDLMDDHNQNDNNPNLPRDRVSGYTIQQVEQGLRGSISWNQWRNNMMVRHTNFTELFVPELFSNWQRNDNLPLPTEDEYLVGDWNGDGKDNIAVRRGNKIIMDYNFDSEPDHYFFFGYGNQEDEYLVGDWDGDGKDNIAVRRNNQIIMDFNFDGNADGHFYYGFGNQEPEYLVLDWDGDGKDNVAVRRSNGVIIDYTFDGIADHTQHFGLGDQEDEYLINDRDGDGKDNIGLRKGNRLLTHKPNNFVEYYFDFLGNGNQEDQYLIGDWDGDGKDNLAIRRGNEILIDYDFDNTVDFSFEYGFGTN